jgi:hypothetical protein
MDSALRDTLRRRSLVQAHRFSWPVAAEQTLDLLERAATGG